MAVGLELVVEPASVVAGGMGIDFRALEVVGDRVCHDMEPWVLAEEFVGEPVDLVGIEGDSVNRVHILVVVAAGQVVFIEFDGGDFADLGCVPAAAAGCFEIKDDSSHGSPFSCGFPMVVLWRFFQAMALTTIFWLEDRRG